MGKVSDIEGIGVIDNPMVEDNGYIQPTLENGDVEVKEDYIFKTIKEKVTLPHDLIKNRSGSRLYQAYLYGLSKELDMKMDDILSLFLDHKNPDTVTNDYFEEMVYNSDKLRAYEWELKQFMKKAGCDRDLFFNEFRSIESDDTKEIRHPCGSDLCPSCNEEEVLRRKRSFLKYVMDVPHTQFTFTVSPSAWNKITWENIGEFYKSVGEAVKRSYKQIYGLEVGVIVNVHTFSSTTLEWQPHADVFVSLKGIDPETEQLKNATIKGMPPEKQKGVDSDLNKKLRKTFTEELRERISGIKLPDKKEKTFWVRQNMTGVCPDCLREGQIIRDGSNYKCKKCGRELEKEELENIVVIKPLMKLSEVEDGFEISGGILGDTLRYFKRLPVSNENILAVKDDMIQFTTDKRKRLDKDPNEDDYPPICDSPYGFYKRVSQHMKPRNFRGLRRYGLYSNHHKYHELAKRKAGFGIDWLDIDLRRGGLREIARETYKILKDMGADVDPDDEDYLSRVGYTVANVERHLKNEGILSGDVDYQDRLLRVVRSLIDYACKGYDYNMHEKENREKPVLSVTELHNLMCCDSGKKVKDLYGHDGYEIYDTVIKKVFSGLTDPITNDDKELMMWVGFSCYGKVVSKSVVAEAIFNTHDFKNNYSSLFSLMNDSNNYFPKLKDPPEGDNHV